MELCTIVLKLTIHRSSSSKKKGKFKSSCTIVSAFLSTSDFTKLGSKNLRLPNKNNKTSRTAPLLLERTQLRDRQFLTVQITASDSI